MGAPRQRLDEESAEATRRLVTELLRLKECSGLSYEGLAERTGYSRSSWQRFLNGGKAPTRAAVEQLADVAGGDRDRLLALWEYARETDDHLLAPDPQPTPTTVPFRLWAVSCAPALPCGGGGEGAGQGRLIAVSCPISSHGAAGPP